MFDWMADDQKYVVQFLYAVEESNSKNITCDVDSVQKRVVRELSVGVI